MWFPAAATLAAAAVLAASDAALARSDGICARLEVFYEAPFVSGVHHRSIDVRWIGSWLDLDHGWHLECRSTGDLAAKSLCDWLPHNISFEFKQALAERILQCKSRVRLKDRQVAVALELANASIYTHDRYVHLEMDFRPRQHNDAALRLTAFETSSAHGYNEAIDPLPPLFDADDKLVEPGD